MYRGYRDFPFGCFKSRRFDRVLISHSGNAPGFKSHVDQYSDDDLCFIVLSNLSIDYQAQELARDLAAILFDEPYDVSPLKSEISIDPNTLTDYTGDYAVSSNKSFSVFVRDARMYTRFSRHDRHRIYPCSEDRFFYRWQEAELQFLRNDEGRVSAVEFIAPRSKGKLLRIEP